MVRILGIGALVALSAVVCPAHAQVEGGTEAGSGDAATDALPPTDAATDAPTPVDGAPDVMTQADARVEDSALSDPDAASSTGGSSSSTGGSSSSTGGSSSSSGGSSSGSGGSSSGSGGGSGDADAGDEPSESEDDEGCGCSVPGKPAGGTAGLVAAALVAGLVLRRRSVG
jgi:MYXO-CTERM domain-containing protein